MATLKQRSKLVPSEIFGIKLNLTESIDTPSEPVIFLSGKKNKK